MNVALARPEATLDSRYEAPEGWLYMTGMQALVRLPIQQRLRDAAAGSQHRRVYFRLSRLAARALRHRALARGAVAQATQHRLPPRPQRGPGRDRDLGRAISQQLSRRDRRWRVRHLVRQGAGRRSLGRRLAPCQFHRRFAQGRRDRARRRRPRREVLDRGQFLRHVVHRRRHAGASIRRTLRSCSTTACTASPCRGFPAAGSA